MQTMASAVVGVVAIVVVAVLAQAAEAPAPTSQPEMRAQWQPPSSPFIRHWLLCGQLPAPSPTDNGLDTDYLADRGGEAALVPTEGMTHRGPDGKTYTWVAYDSPTDVVDIAAALKTSALDNSVTYAFATLRSDKATPALLALGSDDGVRLWVNGKEAFRHVIGRAAKADDDAVQIDLLAGENRLLFKVQNDVGGVGVCARLADMSTLALRPASLQITKSADPAVLKVQLDSDFYQQIPGLAPAQVQLVAAGGKAVESRTAGRGQALSFGIGKLSDGAYELRCQSTTPTGDRVVSHTPYYKGDMLEACKRLIARAKSAAADDLTTPMLAEMVLDRLGGTVEGLTAVPAKAVGSVQSALAEAEELELARGGQADAQIHAYGFTRLAYVDEIDGSVQFCRAYLPAHHDPAKRWPMVVSLHGYNPPNPRYIGWWSVDQRHHALADQFDVIVIEPHGRGNTSYEGLGRLDVLKCIELAKSRFAVDDDRVLLMGYSMGGWGTWHVGTRHPDLFAAIAPVYGGSDYRASLSAEELGKLTPLRRFLEERGSSLAQADALLSTPVFVNHGDADTLVPVAMSRYNVQQLARWGYNVRYWEHPGLGHGDLGCEAEVMRWFLGLRRTSPTHVRLRALELKTARSHWVSVEQRSDQMGEICADAEIVAPNTIRLGTQNALQVRLSPPAPLVDRTKPLKISWNAAEPQELTADASGAIVLRSQQYTPGPRDKTPQCEGPAYELYNAPFAYVLGTVSADANMRAACQLQVQRAADSWETWQHARPRIIKDADLTDADMAKYSLVLIGGAEANLVTRKLSEQIPLKIEGDTVTIDGHAFTAPNAAVQMIYPNPANPARSVVVCAATSATGMFQLQGIDDGMDFAVSDGRIGDWRAGVPEEKVLVASGFFDHRWRYSEQSTIVGDEAIRAKAPKRKVPVHMTAPTDVDRLMLSDLVERNTQGSFREMRRDLSLQNKPMVLGGKTYQSGIAANVWRDAPCSVDFALPEGAGFKHLKATIGIETDDPAKIGAKEKEMTRVLFIVRGDGKELYRSPAFGWQSPPADIDVDITAVKNLRLELAGEGQFNAATSVDWADARIEK